MMYVQAVLGLILVIGLMIGTVFLLKYVERLKSGVSAGQKARLSVSGSLYLDPKHRLILVKRDDEEHLLLVGGASDVVIEKNIKPQSDKAEK